MFPITNNFLTNIPKTPYRKGVGQYEGIVVHATANWEDNDTMERNYEEGGGKQQAFVHFFVDHDSITQVAPTEYKAWGAGPKANERFIHIELCQSHDSNRFRFAYERWIWLAAYLLYQRHLGVSQAKSDGSGTLWSHKNVTDFLGGTTHQDPIEYLAYHGKTWNDVVTDVSIAYLEMSKPNTASIQSKEETTMEPWLKDIIVAKIKTLGDRGIIDSPSFWLDHLDGEHLGALALILISNELTK